MEGRIACPKCGGRSWLVRDFAGLVQRCLCGLTRPIVEAADGNTTIIRTAVRASEVVLPQKGTKTNRCLMAVHGAWPEKINTGEVARRARLENKETSSLLMTLMARGLVERISERRGLLGGSEWKITIPTLELLKL